MPEGASAAELKRAYRALTKVWHPDRFADDADWQLQGSANLAEINAAYDLLSKRPQAPHHAAERTPAPQAAQRSHGGLVWVALVAAVVVALGCLAAVAISMLIAVGVITTSTAVPTDASRTPPSSGAYPGDHPLGERDPGARPAP